MNVHSATSTFPDLHSSTGSFPSLMLPGKLASDPGFVVSVLVAAVKYCQNIHCVLFAIISIDGRGSYVTNE